MYSVTNLLRTLQGDSVYVSSLAMLPGGILASGSRDKTINLWNPSNGDWLRILKGHLGNVESLVVLSGEILASGSRDATIKLWNSSTGECLRTLQGHSGYVFSLVMLPDGILASGSGDKTIKLWDPSNGECLRTLQGHSDYVSSLATLPGGILASGSYDKTIKFWNPTTKECLCTLQGHSDYVSSLATLPDGILASGSKDAIIKLWNSSTGECLRTLQGHTGYISSLVPLPGGILASGSYDKTIKFWNPSTGECLCTLHGHSDYVSSLAVLPGGILASGSYDKTIKLWQPLNSLSESFKLEQLSIYCQQALQHLKTKALEEDNSIDENLICPITGELFIDPVVIDDEGHTFERSAILEHFARSETCPTCRAEIRPEDRRNLKLNRLIREMANKIRDKSPVPMLAAQVKDEKTTDRYLKLVQDFIQEGNSREALKHLTEAIQSSNKTEHYELLPSLYEKLNEPAKAALAYVYLLQYQLRDNKFSQAQATIQEILRLAGSTRVVALSIKKILAALHQAKGNIAEAYPIYLELAELCPLEAQMFYEKAFQCNSKNIEIYEKLAAFYPDSRKVHLYLLGFLHFYELQQDQALVFYQKAREIAPDYPLIPLAHLSRLSKEQTHERLDLYRLIADLLIQQKNIRAALNYLKKAIRSEESYDFHRYVSALIQLDERQEAEKVFLKWSATARCSPVEVIYEGIEALGETSPLLERLITLLTNFTDPLLTKITLNLGTKYARENKRAEAIRVHELAYRHFQDFENGLQLAEMLRLENRIEESFNLADSLSQAAFFKDQEENTVKGFQQLLKLKSQADKLTAQQKQFLMLASMMLQQALLHPKDKMEDKQETVVKKDKFLPVLELTNLEKVASSLETNQMSLLRILQHEDCFERPLAVLPSGLLASASTGDYSIGIWNPSTGKLLRKFRGHSWHINHLAVLPGGALASSSDDNTIKIWNSATGECRTLKNEQEEILSIIVLSGGALASIGEDNTIKLWNPSTGDCFQCLKGHSNRIRSLVELPDGTLASSSDDETIKIWNPVTGECFRSMDGHSTWGSLALLTGGFLACGSADHCIKLLNPSTGDCFKTLRGHSGSITSLIGLPDGILASGSNDKSIKLWDSSTGDCLKTLHGHSGYITSLNLLPGKILASTSADRTIKLWSISTGECLNTLKEYSVSVFSITSLPGGIIACTDMKYGDIELWGNSTQQSTFYSDSMIKYQTTLDSEPLIRRDREKIRGQ